VLGAVLVNYAKTYFTSGALATYWLFMLGSLFIAVTLLLPRGIIGTVQHWSSVRREYLNAKSAAMENGIAPDLALKRPAE
jgi:urea transport system permease protein